METTLQRTEVNYKTRHFRFPGRDSNRKPFTVKTSRPGLKQEIIHIPRRKVTA